MSFQKSDFGENFLWGVATASYQIEGAKDKDGKSPSIWDTFSHTKGKIENNENADIACDFYHRYPEDLTLLKAMNFDVFRFSLAWTRILPDGIGRINQKGLDYYHRVIDKCLELGLQPWPTLYHWDLPQCLYEKGGWTNRDIVSWFTEFTDVCTREFGDKVKNWMVFNEPAVFCILGHVLGTHAPGERSVNKFMQASHHVCLSQGESGRVIRGNVADAHIGTTYSCMHTDAYSKSMSDLKAARRMNTLLNRLYIEPALGMGYPVDNGWEALKKMEKYTKGGDITKMAFDFDFIGLQNYSRMVVRAAPVPPYMWAMEVPPKKRGITQLTDMGWEVYPEGMYKILKQFGRYNKKIIITENGSAFPDFVQKGAVHDKQRIQFFKDYLSNVLKAKQEGVDIQGYFVWTLMDNFEWAEGYRPRFGLVYIDYKTQKRIMKDSGKWFQEFLR